MKIGLFGGTFNPPHVGHLIVAEAVRDELDLEKIYFIPSFISPHKQSGEDDLSDHRLTMVALAVKDNPHFEALGVEIERKNISYTVDTLEELHKKEPHNSFFLLIGMDNYVNFHTWKNVDRIFELSSLVVMNRPNVTPALNPNLHSKKVCFASVPNIELSSSELRERIIRGESIKHQVPDPVLDYIQTHGLYK